MTGAEGRRFCRQYCLRLRYSLPELPRLRRRLVRQVRDELQAYLAQHPDAGEDELYARFGLPEQAALDALAGLEPKAVQRQLARGRWYKLLALLAVGLAAAWALRTVGMRRINESHPSPVYQWWQLSNEWPFPEDEDPLQAYRDAHNGESPPQLPPDAKPPEGVIVHATDESAAQPNG